MKTVDLPPQVLIVEDEAIISLDIKRLLNTSGFGVAAVAATAEQAIRAIETSAPDVVLMDIHIKGDKDGIETALNIRDRFHLPVIFVTAHADKATLERARETAPFGFIVKPISALSLTSTVEMAIHKHRMERKLEEHRAWLATLLQGIPNAVIVADLAGRVQFLNSAAERLLENRQSQLLGQLVDHVLPLSSDDRNDIASEILDKAEWGGRVAFPKETFLHLKAKGHRIPIEGEVVVSYRDDQPVGAIFSFRDIARREQEDSIERQEERMLALGRLASIIAQDFSSLHALLRATCRDLSTLADSLEGEPRASLLNKTGTIAQVNSIALLMTEQLIGLNQPPKVRATLVSASGVVASVEPLLNKLCAGTLELDIRLTDQSTLVLCHPDRLSILLVNVFLNAREQMADSGRIRLSTAQAPRNRVAIVFDLEQPGGLGGRAGSFDLSLSIAHALVAAMEGSISFVPLSNKQGRIEVLLPLQHAPQDLVQEINRSGTILLVGADLALLATLEEWLGEARYAVIRCSSAAEALLLGQLYDGKIDCIVTDWNAVSASERRKLRAFFSNRNAVASFVSLGPDEQPSDLGWLSFPKTPHLSVLDQLARLLHIPEPKMKGSP